MSKKLLVRVMAVLAQVEIEERYVNGGDKEMVHGLRWPGKIVINPVPAIVDSIVHECLHEIFPPETHSDRAIRGMTTKIVQKLSDDEFKAIYSVFKSRTKPSP